MDTVGKKTLLLLQQQNERTATQFDSVLREIMKTTFPRNFYVSIESPIFVRALNLCKSSVVTLENARN